MTESNAFDYTFGEILKTSNETWFVIILLTVKALNVYFLKADKGFGERVDSLHYTLDYLLPYNTDIYCDTNKC
jgi:hypothetical protein